MNTVLVCEECLKGEWCWYDDLGEQYVEDGIEIAEGDKFVTRDNIDAIVMEIFLLLL